MAETYKVKIRCKNCGTKQEIEIEKGKQVREKECPNCGCGDCLERVPEIKTQKYYSI